MGTITTWADGYGLWHAQVPDTHDAAQVAHRAIMSELALRGPHVSPEAIAVRCTGTGNNPLTLTYVECVPEDGIANLNTPITDEEKS